MPYRTLISPPLPGRCVGGPHASAEWAGNVIKGLRSLFKGLGFRGLGAKGLGFGVIYSKYRDRGKLE